MEDDPQHEASIIHKDWSKFCDIMGKHDHNPFMLGDMVVTPTFYGDGGYPVIAEIEGGRPKKITIDFDPSENEDYDEMEFITNTPNIEEIRAKNKRENTK